MLIDMRAPHLRMTVGVAILTAACAGGQEPSTDVERLAHGREIVERMSTTLAAAQSLSVSFDEIRQITLPNGKPQQLTMAREVVVRRPDRLYARAKGDHDTEAFYDGVGLTLVMHKERVFGQARLPETLDKALDAIAERYGVPLPVGDFLYSSPASALLSDATRGGWVKRETLNGVEHDHLSFTDSGVKWDVWIASDGHPPLPGRLVLDLPEAKRLRHVDITFRDWNLAPQIPADRFEPSVPPDYEGIAIVQRAAVLRHIDKSSASEKSEPER
jgi:hypothetical protein